MGELTKFGQQARQAAERLDRARAAGEQLTFLPDPDGGKLVPAADAEGKKIGRPKGSKNKVQSQLREMLAAKGHRMPEDVLAEIAGLSGREDVVLLAMARTEQVLAWAGDGAKVRVTREGRSVVLDEDWEASPAQRLATFIEVYKQSIRALEALLPYGLAKVTPDQAIGTQINQLILPAGTPRPGDDARVVNGQSDGRFAPPPLPGERQQNQALDDAENPQSDGESRTE